MSEPTSQPPLRFFVRERVPADDVEWARMREALWPGAGADDERSLWLAQPDTTVLVAIRPDGGLAGFAEVGTRSYAEGCDESPVAYLEGWYVDPDLRRRGIGRLLMAAAEAWARQRGHRELASDSTLDNDAAQRAHEALGFEETDRVVMYRKSL